MNVPTLARKYNSPIAHRLIVGTKRTHCGQDATLMARWNPADAGTNSDSRRWKDCAKCYSATH